MWDNFIGTQIRRANRNLLLTNVGIILVLALLAGANERYFVNFFAGPTPISAQALTAVQNPDQLRRYYVTVTGEKTLDTSVTEVEQEKDKYSDKVRSERTTAHFLIMKVNQKALLVKSPDGTTNTQITGALVTIPSDVRSNTIDSFIAEEPAASGLFLPMMLDATDFKTPGYIGLAIGIPLFALGCWNVLKALKRCSDFNLHPIAQTLNAYGDSRDVAGQIDNETRLGVNKYGRALVSSNWLLQPVTYGLNVTKLENIVWTYKKVTQHRTNFIPTGKTFAAVLVNRNGNAQEISGSERDADALLMHLSQRLPWILMGFDKELQQAWNQNSIEVINAVDQRRQTMNALNGSIPHNTGAN